MVVAVDGGWLEDLTAKIVLDPGLIEGVGSEAGLMEIEGLEDAAAGWRNGLGKWGAAAAAGVVRAIAFACIICSG